MASTKDLKKRIGTVKNTQQTTRAMKMVSAAKLRRAQEAVQNQRPFAKKILELIQILSSQVKMGENHPLYHRKDSTAPTDVKKILLVAVTSDRGLCGGFNSSIIKGSQRWIQNNSTSTVAIEMAFVGRRGYDFFKTKSVKIVQYFQEAGGKVSFAKAKKLANALLEIYKSGQVDEIKFIFNEFKNAVTQKVIVEDFLPVAGMHDFRGGSDENAPPLTLEYIVKPSPEDVLRELLSKSFAAQTFRILLESQAGEHGARMSAMENATKNAGDMIRKLTLQYNKQRQAGITKELLEIISGSESQKG